MSADSMWFVLDGVANAFAPLESYLATDDSVREYLKRLGWEPPADVGVLGLDPALPRAVSAAAVLAAAPGLSDEETVLRYGAVAAAVAATVAGVYSVRDRIAASVDPAYVAASGFDAVPDRIFENLFADALSDSAQTAYYVLVALGLFEEVTFGADPASFRTEHSRVAVRTDRVELLLDPPRLLNDVYGWGEAAGAVDGLVVLFGRALGAAGVEVRLQPPIFEKEVNLSAPAVVPPEGFTPSLELEVVLFHSESGPATLEGGVAFMAVPGVEPAARPGIAITPWLAGTLDLSVPLESSGRWTLEITATGDLSDGVAVVLRPESAPRLTADIFGDGGGAATVELNRIA